MFKSMKIWLISEMPQHFLRSFSCFQSIAEICKIRPRTVGNVEFGKTIDTCSFLHCLFSCSFSLISYVI